MRSRSSVSFVNDALPTAATGRSTHRFTRPPSPTTARPWAAPSPTPTPAPYANTWRFTSSRHLPLNPRTRTTPSLINSSNLTRRSSSPSTWKWTGSLLHSPTRTLTFLFCLTTSSTSAPRAKRTTSCCYAARLRWRCLWICLCLALRVSWPRNSRVAGPHGGASAQSTQPYLSCLTLKSGMSVPGLQHHTSLCFTQTTLNQNLVMMTSTSRRMESLVNWRWTVELIHSQTGSGQRMLCGINGWSCRTVQHQRPLWDGDGEDQTVGCFTCDSPWTKSDSSLHASEELTFYRSQTKQTKKIQSSDQC